jgi:hypothetical protein
MFWYDYKCKTHRTTFIGSILAVFFIICCINLNPFIHDIEQRIYAYLITITTTIMLHYICELCIFVNQKNTNYHSQ